MKLLYSSDVGGFAASGVLEAGELTAQMTSIFAYYQTTVACIFRAILGDMSVKLRWDIYDFNINLNPIFIIAANLLITCPT